MRITLFLLQSTTEIVADMILSIPSSNLAYQNFFSLSKFQTKDPSAVVPNGIITG
jgi:hypothetical protein